MDMPFLVLATLRQNKRVIRYLLSQGVENVNVRDDASGNTPLHYAIMMLDGEKEDGTCRAWPSFPPSLPPSLPSFLPPSLRRAHPHFLSLPPSFPPSLPQDEDEACVPWPPSFGASAPALGWGRAGGRTGGRKGRRKSGR